MAMHARRIALALVMVGAAAIASPLELAGKAPANTEPAGLLPLVGVWTVQQDATAIVVAVDGQSWRQGTAAPNLNAKSEAAFPDNAKAFADAVRHHAAFPLALVKDVPSFDQGTVTVRFQPVAGREDQAAGIAFDVRASGDYLILRANGLEDNLILFQFKNGRRSVLKQVRIPAPKRGEWHELKLVVEDGIVRGSVDGQPSLDFSLKRRITGRLGLWSKADSVVQFKDLEVRPGS